MKTESISPSPSKSSIGPYLKSTTDSFASITVGLIDYVAYRPQTRAQRVADILISFLALVLLSPLMLFIMILVKLDSKGPIFYAQTRVGANLRRRILKYPELHAKLLGRPGYNRRRVDVCGKLFSVLKFRSMSTDAEADGRSVWCQKNDARITRVGRLLRKTHMDELPQLINILRGEMSLVGPRPERPDLVLRLRDAIAGYEDRLSVTPGVTGLAQIRHRADLHIDDVRKKIKYDLLYIRGRSLSTDFRIILGTLPMVLGISTDGLKKIRKDSPTVRVFRSLFKKRKKTADDFGTIPIIASRS